MIAACSEDELVWIGLPPLDGASGMILTVTQTSQQDATAFDLAAGPVTLTLPFNATDKVAELSAYLYDAPLPFPPGKLKLAVAGEPGSPPPTPNRTYGARIQQHEIEPWIADRPLGAEIRLPITQRQDCVSFQFENVPFGNDTPYFVLTLNRDEVLFSVNQLLGVIRDQGAVEITNPTGDVIVAGSTDQVSNTVWLAGARGGVWYGERRTPLQLRRVPSTTTAQALFIAGGLDGNDQPEVFIFSRTGRVLRYYQGVEEEIHQFDLSNETYPAGGIVRSEFGIVTAASISSPKIVAYDKGNKREEELEPSFNEGLGALAYTETLGAVVATTRGKLFRNLRTWGLIAQSEARIDIFGLEPYRGFLIAAGRLGFFAQVTPNGFCSAVTAGNEALLDLAVLDQDPILMPGRPAPEGTYYFRRMRTVR